ncbi:MAG TPA: hypothetical protein VFR67_09095 [Pilimelia sp.]|nr:hypothetical protein [Pilimelia sp.]
MARQRAEVDLSTALAATMAELAEAARHAGGGLRTTGRWARGAGARTGRRALEDMLRSAQRANLAYQVMRGVPPPVRRRTTLETVGVAIAGGVFGAATTTAVQRVLAYRAANGASAAEESTSVTSTPAGGTPAEKGDASGTGSTPAAARSTAPG